MANPSRPPQNGRFYTQDDPAMDIYRDAWATLKANTHVNNPALSELDRIYLRGIQTTYKVKVDRFPRNGFKYQMMFIWDYDRIWGSFDFGSVKGMLMVDHGPDEEPPEYEGYQASEEEENDQESDQERDLIYYDFIWRGRTTTIPG
ncbi:hypothetical protein VP1G_08167 [Cytospora mali]|uniref:Uncharacterized protein n=1 Tax=Cytospora mali TaxID=578113 RepID=A0A194VAB4_CYTMA|nr:hypothetical protein VP1G_08167 [Valsa mali var. pyri (nom. inval.)]